jgi:hypothetical protein
MAPDTTYYIICQRCGRYWISDDAKDSLAEKPFSSVQRGTVSGWLRQNPKQRILRADVQRLYEMPALAVSEQADRLLRHLAKLHPQPGATFAIPLRDPDLQATAWAYGDGHMTYLIRDYLAKLRRIDVSGAAVNSEFTATIAPEGWARLEQLQSVNPDSPHAFIAMHFDASTDDIRQAADRGVGGLVSRTIVDEKPSNDHLDETRRYPAVPIVVVTHQPAGGVTSSGLGVNIARRSNLQG